MEPKFVVDPRGALGPGDGQPSPLTGRTGQYRLQPTSPDLVLLVRTPAQGGQLEQRPRVVLAGDVATFAVQDLIAFLGQARWSGAIRIASPGHERTLLLKDGEVRSASSDATADRIGEVMIRLGFVTRAQVTRVLDSAPPSRLGRAMVERGLLKAHDLYKCLNEQISEIFHGMMLAKEGTFVLIDQELDERVLVHNLSLSVQGLLMDSIRKIDELAQFRKKIPHSNVTVGRKKLSDGKLEAEEDALLALVDGRQTLLELAQASKLSEFDTTRIVYRLLEGGYVALAQAETGGPESPEEAVSGRGAAAHGGTDEQAVVSLFNAIFREVHDEVARHGGQADFVAAANAALRGSGLLSSQVLAGLSFESGGTLPEAAVLAQFDRMRSEGHMGSEPLMSLRQALSDVMFFLLFQAGEMLESRADEDLARRVKELLALLDTK